MCLQIGYWRYISIYRHLQRNPDSQLYPLFEYFENWCQDENRHGDFFTAILKSQPQARPPWLPEGQCWWHTHDILSIREAGQARPCLVLTHVRLAQLCLVCLNVHKKCGCSEQNELHAARCPIRVPCGCSDACASLSRR